MNRVLCSKISMTFLPATYWWKLTEIFCVRFKGVGLKQPSGVKNHAQAENMALVIVIAKSKKNERKKPVVG